MKVINQVLSKYIFLLIGFYAIDDFFRVYRLLEFGYGLPSEWGQEWGIIVRIGGPATMILIALSSSMTKPTQISFILFGVARFLSLNSMLIERKLNLGFSAMIVAFLADIIALYLSLVGFRQSRDRDRVDRIHLRRLLIVIMLAAFATILVWLVGFMFVIRNGR
jgi:hypothetical protein